MFKILDSQPTQIHNNQAHLQSLPLFRPIQSWVGPSNTTDVLKTGGSTHRNISSGRFTIKGGFTGTGAQRRMVIVGKIGKF